MSWSHSCWSRSDIRALQPARANTVPWRSSRLALTSDAAASRKSPALPPAGREQLLAAQPRPLRVGGVERLERPPASCRRSPPPRALCVSAAARQRDDAALRSQACQARRHFLGAQQTSALQLAAAPAASGSRAASASHQRCRVIQRVPARRQRRSRSRASCGAAGRC